MRIIILIITIIASFSVLANSTVYGLTLDNTTIQELKNNFSVSYAGINKYSQGEMYNIPTKQIKFDGLNEVTAIFNKSGKLVAVLSEFPKSKFNYINSALTKKYNLISQDIPFVGNKRVVYRDGSTEITLNAPHMSFDMSMQYISDSFNKAYDDITQREARQKTQQESKML